MAFEIEAGKLLISSITLEDQNFKRSAVLLCEHNEGGTFGLVLNRELNLTVSEVMENIEGWDAPLYLGGPVQPNSIHFLHRFGTKAGKCLEISPGIWWGGEYELVKTLLDSGLVSPDDVRFFLGYSGWGAGQLAGEITESAWIMGDISDSQLFDEPADRIWSRALKRLGGDFALLANFPDNPQLN